MWIPTTAGLRKTALPSCETQTILIRTKPMPAIPVGEITLPMWSSTSMTIGDGTPSGPILSGDTVAGTGVAYTVHGDGITGAGAGTTGAGTDGIGAGAGTAGTGAGAGTAGVVPGPGTAGAGTTGAGAAITEIPTTTALDSTGPAEVSTTTIHWLPIPSETGLT